MVGLGLVAAGQAAVPAVAHGTVPAQPQTAEDVSPLPVLGPAPEFHLHSLQGPNLRLNHLRGKVVLVAFVCASCPDEPEDIAAGFAALQARLKDQGLFGRKVVLIFVVRHPEWETGSGFRAYAAQLGVDPYGWVILNGSADTTARLRDAFGRVGRPGAARPAETRGRVYLVDYTGRVRRVYEPGTFGPDAALKDLEMLL